MRLVLTFILSFILAGCKPSEPPNTIKVGTISGPETSLMEVAQKVAKEQYGLNIVIVQFADYLMPNTALHEGSIDANVYQHMPYLEETLHQHHYQFIAIGKTFIYPMALYSSKIKNLQQLPEKAVIAIPNDPSNQARALLLLDSAGVIKLKTDVGTETNLEDIAYNPKHVTFKELDAAQIPRSMPDVDLAAINTNYAFTAGLLPKKDGLFMETENSPYANLIVIREVDKDKKELQNLVKALHSQPVLDKAKELFKDQAIPAWK